MKFEAKCISAETQYLHANRCTTVYELERKYCYEIFKKEKLISLMPPLFGYVFSSLNYIQRRVGREDLE
ncbi:hypothetical protein T03_3801 [Trichinella britovi]|uniref:Uncharacterized protein n=1 Tax=Trichinella britovi TaxID=45882 RepID=A0A0V1CR06_TRIBR|nr:hypothetical protein T03_3801 [Trichinella britovi]